MSQEDNTHIFIRNCIAKALNNCHTLNLDANNEEITLASNTHTLDDQTDILVDYQSVLADLSSSESLSNPMYTDNSGITLDTEDDSLLSLLSNHEDSVHTNSSQNTELNTTEFLPKTFL